MAASRTGVLTTRAWIEEDSAHPLHHRHRCGRRTQCGPGSMPQAVRAGWLHEMPADRDPRQVSTATLSPPGMARGTSPTAVTYLPTVGGWAAQGDHPLTVRGLIELKGITLSDHSVIVAEEPPDRRGGQSLGTALSLDRTQRTRSAGSGHRTLPRMYGADEVRAHVQCPQGLGRRRRAPFLGPNWDNSTTPGR